MVAAPPLVPAALPQPLARTLPVHALPCHRPPIPLLQAKGGHRIYLGGKPVDLPEAVLDGTPLTAAQKAKMTAAQVLRAGAAQNKSILNQSMAALNCSTAVAVSARCPRDAPLPLPVGANPHGSMPLLTVHLCPLLPTAATHPTHPPTHHRLLLPRSR